VAEIFVSYTDSDRVWAHWIAKALESLGHTPHVHDWEISAGADIYSWMETRHDAADHVLCVVSDEYLRAPFSTLERNAALWQAAKDRPGFVLLVAVKPCRLPTLSDHLRRCELFGIPEEAARVRLREFMTARAAPDAVVFPGRASAVSNIPIRVPEHFIGRDDALAAIEAALARHEGRVAITALHGLRGVGKTTLAAAYAERHRGDFRATWWIRAQTETGTRADLVALGNRLGWVGANDKEEPALAALTERLRHEGEGILLIFDNAIDANALKPYLPRGGAAKVLVTSNAHAWREVAAPVAIRQWPKDIGAGYLIARTGREGERSAAEALSETLGGLPLAHEQAAAYCERLDIPLSEFGSRLAAAPARLLDDARHAPAEYHDGMTVAKTFALAIEESAKLHPAAEALIVHAALLAPDPIPLLLFSEAREKFGEPLARTLAGHGLDEAVAALRAFALVDRETIRDERDSGVATETIRLHRVVREVAAARCDNEARQQVRRTLVAGLAAVYPGDGLRNQASWPRCGLLAPHVLASCETAFAEAATERASGDLLNNAGNYFHGRTAYAAARPLLQRALSIREKVLGAEHPDTAASLNDLVLLLKAQGEYVGAKPLCERALAIREKVLGAEHADTAASLNNLGFLLWAQGEVAAARPLLERALAIREKTLGPDHPDTAMSINDLAFLLQYKGDRAAARALYERALAIREKVLGAEHPDTAASLNNLALLLTDQGDLAAARPLYQRALAIDEKVLGPQHPGTATDLSNYARLLRDSGETEEAERLFLRAIAIGEKALVRGHPVTQRYASHYARLLLDTERAAEALDLAQRALAAHALSSGPSHPWTKDSARVTADALAALGKTDEAAALRARYGLDPGICPPG
jgi:tetratricopeptide (TPR) repeat protein